MKLPFFAFGLFSFVMLLAGSLTAQQKEKAPPKEFTNDIGMKFVWIPPGTFMMGSPEDEEGRFKFNPGETQHKVILSKGFYMGIYEVTQKQWQAIMGKNPSREKGDDLPVTMVSWKDCGEFLEKMGKKDDRSYRLPTEAEWEYSCRAGTTGAFSCPAVELPDYAWYRENARNKTHRVGTKKPNAWGLYDMHGNVEEWCFDHSADYAKEPVVDPKNPPGSKIEHRVKRGGSSGHRGTDLRSACRDSNEPEIKNFVTGLRAVMDYKLKLP